MNFLNKYTTEIKGVETVFILIILNFVSLFLFDIIYWWLNFIIIFIFIALSIYVLRKNFIKLERDRKKRWENIEEQKVRVKKLGDELRNSIEKIKNKK